MAVKLLPWSALGFGKRYLLHSQETSEESNRLHACLKHRNTKWDGSECLTEQEECDPWLFE